MQRAYDYVYYKRVEPEAFRILKALESRLPFDASVEAAFEDSKMPEDERIASIQAWFANWAELGWFCRPRRRSTV